MSEETTNSRTNELIYRCIIITKKLKMLKHSSKGNTEKENNKDENIHNFVINKSKKHFSG